MQIISLFVMALGFVIAPLTDGVMPPTLFYWLGFILYFGLPPTFRIPAMWRQWGRRGLYINMLVMAFVYLLLYFGQKLHITENYYYYLQRGLHYIVRPISQSADLFYPNKMAIMPDGSIHISVDYLKSAITNFLDIMFYISGSIIIGKIVSSRRKGAYEVRL